ncbi:MAG TPA: aminotransferase class I/II-fold pyridoxal phosphate-dependent enzyme [bacterium]|nr:aminotransferase class I/II-fold pyridoxal phosphate-dependent enzyme [bacterium]
MDINVSKRLSELTGYAFAEIDKKVARLKAEGVDVTDFGVGDPTEPTPDVVRQAIKGAVDSRATSGYPSYTGAGEFRDAIAAWTKRRFGIELDPATEISASIGSKEAVFNFPEAFVDPGDFVLVPNPGYPPYTRGTRFAEGRVHYLNLLSERGFLPDLDSIPDDVLKRAKILWINYPNNPTGAVAPDSFFEAAVAFGRRHGIVVASDEAYTENYYGARPRSILEFRREGVISFQSLSKRSCMTGYRVGWVAGDEKIVSAFKKLKTNIDSGTPTFIQDAAMAALSDELHVEELRKLYMKKRDLICDAFVSAGLSECRPEATLYVWQRVPDGYSSLSFAERLLDPSIAAAVTPGSWISEPSPEGNPGEGFVRLALVPTVEQCERVASRIANFKF